MDNELGTAVGISVVVIPLMTITNILIGFAVGMIIFFLIRWGANKSEEWCGELSEEAKKIYKQISKEQEKNDGR